MKLPPQEVFADGKGENRLPQGREVQKFLVSRELELQAYLDDLTGKNEIILNQNGSEQSERRAPMPLTQVTLLFIPSTFGRTP